jgi:predicted MFS family arabinose efflux permease
MIRLPARPVSSQTHKVSAWESIRDGVRIALGTAEIRNLFVVTFFTGFFGFQYSVLLPALVTDVYHGTAQTLGWLTAATAVGSLAASLFFAARGKPEVLKRILKLALAAVAVSLVALSTTASLPVAMAILVVVGIGFSLQFNSCNSLLQLTVTDATRGRIMGMYAMILLGAAPFGSLVMGRLSDSFGAPLAVALCGGACAISTLFYVTRK